jgi:hypothetical protein
MEKTVYSLVEMTYQPIFQETMDRTSGGLRLGRPGVVVDFGDP